MTTQAQRNAENFSRMLEHVSGGLSLESVTSAELKDASCCCAHCGETEMCEIWLDQARKSERRAPGFCPNSPGIWSRLAV